MVENSFVNRRKLDAIPLVASSGRRPHTQKTHNYIMNVWLGCYLFIPVSEIAAEHPLDSNAGAGCGLPGNGDIGLADDNVAMNDPGYLEDNNTRPRTLTCRQQAPGARRIQVCNLDYPAAAAARCISAKALCSWESCQRMGCS
ncbi:MAG: hypothetical protein ACYSWZ_08790 [Planctomycetota bacterium]